VYAPSPLPDAHYGEDNAKWIIDGLAACLPREDLHASRRVDKTIFLLGCFTSIDVMLIDLQDEQLRQISELWYASAHLQTAVSAVWAADEYLTGTFGVCLPIILRHGRMRLDVVIIYSCKRLHSYETRSDISLSRSASQDASSSSSSECFSKPRYST
jgi:hypothetical protein